MATTLVDIYLDIMENHILPRLDVQSLFNIATVSSYLPAITSDRNLWSHISKCTWPSVTHPHVDELIPAFPGGYRSFFRDSFPSLIMTQLNQRSNSNQPVRNPDCSTHPRPSKLISAVDIFYQRDVIYSTVQFTDITSAFLSSELLIELNEDAINNGLGSKPVIDLEDDELVIVDKRTLSHLKESLTLSWILIDPTLKRAGNLSSIKPCTVKKDWITNDIVLQYATVLPGCDPNQLVQCRIQVVLGVGFQWEGLRVKEVTMKLMDLDSCCLYGRDFLVISQRAILMENNVIRKVMDDEDILQNHCKFEDMKRRRRKLVKKEEEKRKFVFIMNYFGMLVSFCCSVYFWSLRLQ